MYIAIVPFWLGFQLFGSPLKSLVIIIILLLYQAFIKRPSIRPERCTNIKNTHTYQIEKHENT